MTSFTDRLNSDLKWTAPSNIALVKYWGKKSNQIPCNPSLSVTLKKSTTTTSLKLIERGDSWIDFKLEDKEKESFIPKLESFLNKLPPEWNFLNDFSLQIRSTNSFPHSTGIASSASSMASLALCLMELKMGGQSMDEGFYREASEIARLGSGSASRSVYGQMSLWGDDEEGGNDHYALPYTDFHNVFNGLQNTVLIVSSEQKKISSTLGHKLLEDNIYATTRFKQANENLKSLKNILRAGDFEAFASIVESEALSLHAMMMTSNPGYLLMKPNSLILIEKVREMRKEGFPICFTMDAGPNLHLLYPSDQKDKISLEINRKMIDFCENGKMIHDEMGEGPLKH